MGDFEEGFGPELATFSDSQGKRRHFFRGQNGDRLRYVIKTPPVAQHNHDLQREVRRNIMQAYIYFSVALKLRDEGV